VVPGALSSSADVSEIGSWSSVEFADWEIWLNSGKGGEKSDGIPGKGILSTGSEARIGSGLIGGLK